MVNVKKLSTILEKIPKVKTKKQKITKQKKFLKPSQATVTIKERQPAAYISRFFKDEMEETKNGMFL